MDNTNSIRRIPLAVIGMACRVPGADDLGKFWEMLVAGRSAVADLPPERFDAELYYDPTKGTRNKSYTRRGAIPRSRRFDHDRCPITPALVRKADPTHLVMCQTAADALRHAEMDPTNLPLRNTGVYVGHTIGSGLAGDYDYPLAVRQAADVLRRTEGFTSLPAAKQEAIIAGLVQRVRSQFPRRTGDDPELASNMAAGLIAKGFGLAGPFAAVNAACASSPEALLLAGRALARGKIDMAIVGGASVCGLDWLVLFSAAQSVSPGDSRPFDHRADGLVIAEAYAAVVVKTLDRAVADGDPIHAVVRGIGISSDGRGRSLWAPRCEGQVEAIRRAYDAGAEMGDIEYIEAHATATQLGDATEIAALTETLGGVFAPDKKIPITSVKANIGHALEAAGLIGVIKSALCMRHGLIPPAANLEKLNPAIDWAAAPVYVPTQATPWPARSDGRPRRAGVNAFGVGGLNVHVVLDEYLPGAWARAQRWPRRSSAGPPQGGTDDFPPTTSHAHQAFSENRRCCKATRGSPPPTTQDHAVAVIGLGCVLAGAHSTARFWDLLCSGATGISSLSSQQHEHNAPGGYVRGFEYDWRRHKIPPKQIGRADPLQFMVLQAADEAMAESGYDRRGFDRRRTGVVVGTEFVGDFTFQLQLVLRLPHLAKLLTELLAESGESPERAAEIVTAFADAVHQQWPVLADETGSFSASSLAGRIIKTWDLMGGGRAVDSGATSAAVALGAAMDLLVSGDNDLMFCVAAQRNMNPAAREALATAGRLAAESAAPGPLDRRASGYVPGEGAVVLLLKRLADARRDGDRIRAVIRGVETTHGDDAAEALACSLRRSLGSAGLDASELALAMTDATGLPSDDETVVRAILDCQTDVDRDGPLPIGSVVGHIGHTGGASAAVSLAAAILALEARTSPGVFGLREPIAPLVRAAAGPEPLTHHTPDGQLVGAVLSQDKGAASSMIVESKAGPLDS